LVPVGDEAGFAAAIAAARPRLQDARRTLHQARRFTIEHGADHYIRVMRTVLRRHAEARAAASAAPLVTEQALPTL